jgi:hypothetical protein
VKISTNYDLEISFLSMENSVLCNDLSSYIPIEYGKFVYYFLYMHNSYVVA